MFVTNNPQLQQWQLRLSRMPRWGWIAIFIGMVIPVVVLGASILVIAVAAGLVVFLIAAVFALITSPFRRLRKPKSDGRENVRIVVHSARVVD